MRAPPPLDLAIWDNLLIYKHLKYLYEWDFNTRRQTPTNDETYSVIKKKFN